MNSEAQGKGGNLLPWMVIAASVLMAFGTLFLLIFSGPRESVPKAKNSPLAVDETFSEMPFFLDVTAESGIDFQHFDPATPKHFIHETMGSGVAWLDYDADGWPDLFCVQSGPLVGEALSGLSSKLYRNKRDGTFQDVTVPCGLQKSGYGMGVASGDFDNDGYPDLLVTYLGGLALFHNLPDGQGGRKFEDIATKAGLKNNHWGTSAGWGDIDQDGFLDLYVCNYCEVDLVKYPVCEDSRTRTVLCCPPSHFPAASHKLFRNNKDKTFTDITDTSGISRPSPSPGLAVSLVDLDQDGRLDIYVANDMKPAYLFKNLGGGKFDEVAMTAGCGLGLDGSLVAGMGIAVGEVDGSGLPSLFVTNFEKKPNILFQNLGKMSFREISMRSGLGGPSIPMLKFGTEFLDANLDGNLDLAIANGHIHRGAEKVSDATYAQAAQFFMGKGKARFQEASNTAGAYFRTPMVGRGLAVADFDQDGKPDLAFSHVGGPVKLLRNMTFTNNHSVQIRLVGDGKNSNRDAIGARVEMSVGPNRMTRFVTGGGSYLSNSDYQLEVGLGTGNEATGPRIFWPSGKIQEVPNLIAGASYRIEEGKEPITIRGNKNGAQGH